MWAIPITANFRFGTFGCFFYSDASGNNYFCFVYRTPEEKNVDIILMNSVRVIVGCLNLNLSTGPCANNSSLVT
jgi:hypothetical protein